MKKVPSIVWVVLGIAAILLLIAFSGPVSSTFGQAIPTASGPSAASWDGVCAVFGLFCP